MKLPEKKFDVLPSEFLVEFTTVDLGGSLLHNHDGYELYLLLNGKVNYYIEQDGQHLQRGTLVCIRPYAFHHRELLQTNPTRIVVSVKESKINFLSTKDTDLTKCFFQKRPFFQLNESEIEQFTIFAKGLKNALLAHNFGSEMLAESYMRQILILVNQNAIEQTPLKTQNPMPPIVSETISYINDHIDEDVTLNALSEFCHHNGTYISRCFKNFAGISLQQYIIRKRLSMAKEYLAEGKTPCDTCFLTGFNNYSNFSRIFSKQEGCSPKQYQMKIR